MDAEKLPCMFVPVFPVIYLRRKISVTDGEELMSRVKEICLMSEWPAGKSNKRQKRKLELRITR